VTIKVSHAGYSIAAMGMQGMSVADVRRAYQGRLAIPQRAAAFLNDRSIGGGMEHRVVLRSHDRVAFMKEQEVYVWRKYQGVKTQVYPAK
jgi:hypothetical protein